jgi:hypothetical protein
MDDRRFDSIARQLGTEAPRRRVLKGVAALAVGSLGFVGARQVGLAQVGAANGDNDDRRDRKKERRCKDRCDKKCNGRNDERECLDRCEDRCEDKYDD